MNNNKEKDIFTLIKENNIEKVKELVTKNPNIVNERSQGKPYDIRGMIPFQVALCTNWHKEIAKFLLKYDFNVNHIVTDGNKNPEVRPLLFDVVNVALWNTIRYDYDVNTKSFYYTSSTNNQIESYEMLKEFIKRGSNVNITDNYNRNSLFNAVSEINMIYQTDHKTNKFYPQRQILKKETIDNYIKILRLLIDAGADKNSTSSYTEKNIKETYQNELIWNYLKDLFL